MRSVKKVQKLLYLCAFVTLTIWYIAGFKSTPHFSETKITATETPINVSSTGTKKSHQTDIKYILQWTKPDKQPYVFMKQAQDVFYERKCPVKNCYVTWNKTYLSDLSYYSAILFYSHKVSRFIIRLPKRSIHQKYVFVSPEPAAYYPVYHSRYDSFFNLTWTYKLNSDVFYGYILIRNKKGETVGPKEVMHWPKIEEMMPINDKVKNKLINKKIAAAWFVSNCYTRSGRHKVARQIRHELTKYNMTLDVYGFCGTKILPQNTTSRKILENDYYFYLSFENSISEDYVTEKLLTALQHYTVPIVYGGANYTRFMPDGIYLNARTVTAEDLVKQMVYLINNKEKYYDFFRWNNHYTYYYAGDTPDTDYYCNFCKTINDPNIMNRPTVYKNFAKWWHGMKLATIKP